VLPAHQAPLAVVSPDNPAQACNRDSPRPPACHKCRPTKDHSIKSNIGSESKSLIANDEAFLKSGAAQLTR